MSSLILEKSVGTGSSLVFTIWKLIYILTYVTKYNHICNFRTIRHRLALALDQPLLWENNSSVRNVYFSFMQVKTKVIFINALQTPLEYISKNNKEKFEFDIGHTSLQRWRRG